MTKQSAILSACVLLLAVGLFWQFRRRPENGSKEQNDGSSIPGQAKIQNQVAELEAQRKRLEQTVWGKELAAQKHESVFIRLWDHLRTNANAVRVLKNFEFGELVIGRLGDFEEIEPSIFTRRFTEPLETIPPERWNELVEEFHANGYRVEQSEWRHPVFQFDASGAHRSVIAMWLHIANTNTEERMIVRGNLNVRWRPQADAFPERIDASALEIFTRKGETPFHHVLADALAGEHAPFLEPLLQLYDLDGDGLSEIIMARRNRVFWNKGRGVFRPSPLCEHPLTELSTALMADFDGDARVDLLCADRSGLALFEGDAHGRFKNPPRRIEFTQEELVNPLVMTAGDIDRDGDLDLWLGQYKVPYQGGQMPSPYSDANDGHPSYLLINSGHGEFKDHTGAGGLLAKRFRRTYSSSFVDLDDDADLDLVVVSDFAGVDIYLNDGLGQFSDQTGRLVEENRAFGMAHSFGDYDRDGFLDLLVIGMNSFVAQRLEGLGIDATGIGGDRSVRSAMSYGNRLYFRRGAGFKQTPMSGQLARSGWSWGAATGDFDNDGDLDVYIVNGHISARSAADYEPQFWLHDIYAGKSKDNPAVSEFFRSAHARFRNLGSSYGGFEKNRLFMNRDGNSFLELGYLMGVSLEDDCRNAVADDLDGDGKLDLLTTTFTAWPLPKQELRLFPNYGRSSGNWIGMRLREHGRGFSPIGAKLILTTPKEKQIRQFVTGDSYRSQHSTTAHFGLGNQSQVDTVEVIWPNGKRQLVVKPEINRYHSIIP